MQLISSFQDEDSRTKQILSLYLLAEILCYSVTQKEKTVLCAVLVNYDHSTVLRKSQRICRRADNLSSFCMSVVPAVLILYPTEGERIVQVVEVRIH